MGLIKGSLLGLAAGLSVGLFVNAIKNALEYAGSLGELSRTLGVTTKDFQIFSFAAGQVGVSQEALQTALQKLTITLGQVKVGAEAPAKAFKAIGISVDELKGKDTGEVFRMIADKMKDVSDRTQRAAFEVGVFKKSGAGIDNLLSGAEGSLSEFAQAAEKLGIVLSDDQIQNADKTADKLRAVKTVLEAQIAGVVADNAGAILELANAFVVLVGAIGGAITAWNNFRAASNARLFDRLGNPEQAARARGSAFVSDKNPSIPGSSVTIALPPAIQKPTTGGVNVGKFLAPGGSKKKAAADHSAEDALREQNQFDQELRRAHIDTLRAQQDLARDYIERTSIGVEILNAEKAARDAEHDYQVALYKLTKGKQGQSEAQVAQLKSEEAITDSLAREKLLQDEQEQRQRDIQELTQHDYDRRRDVLQSQAAIANTAAERRKIELELLRLAYEQKRQALQSIIDTSKNLQEQEDARRDLANLNSTYSNEQQAVIRGTRGPLEEWAASVPQTAAQINEALQSIEANGLEGLTDAIAGVITGTESLKEAFGGLAKSIIADIIRMTIRMLIFRAISGIIGGGVAAGGPMSLSGLGMSSGGDVTSSGIYSGIPGFATGGSMRILGRSGTDRNMLSLNGLPMARVSSGERINIANDNVNGGALSRLIIELRDDMLEARIASGAQVQVVRAYPTFRAGAVGAMGERNRRR